MRYTSRLVLLPVTVTVSLTPVSPYDLVDNTTRNEGGNPAQYPILPDLSVQLPILADGTRGVWTVDLSQLNGYTGAFKSLAVTLPARKGWIDVYGIRLRGDD